MPPAVQQLFANARKIPPDHIKKKGKYLEIDTASSVTLWTNQAPCWFTNTYCFLLAPDQKEKYLKANTSKK